VTADCGTPLIRFNQHDAGTLFTQKDIANSVADAKFTKAVENLPWRWNLPFVTLSERSDRTLVFYAANIYPEHIQRALNQSAFFPKLTGRFVMEKRHTKKMDPKLYIVVELQPHSKENTSLKERLQKEIHATLRTVNREYHDASERLVDKDLAPHVELRPYQDGTYFKAGVKARYILSRT
jgi:phenylacetate-coenzyme A ligase PaaK-like adenylate-forming protein